MKTFVIMVDNEVVEIAQFPEIGDKVPEEMLAHFEQRIAIFSSDPRIMPVDEIVEVGSIWDGTTFNPPTV